MHNPWKISKGHFRVCVRYENLSDEDIVKLFSRFINYPVDVNGNYCAFNLPGTGVRAEKGTDLTEGLKAYLKQRNQEFDEQIKREGSKLLGLKPMSGGSEG